MKSAGKNICQSGSYWWHDSFRHGSMVLVKECLDAERVRISVLSLDEKKVRKGAAPEEAIVIPRCDTAAPKQSEEVLSLYREVPTAFREGKLLYTPLTPVAARNMVMGAVGKLQEEREEHHGRLPPCVGLSLAAHPVVLVTDVVLFLVFGQTLFLHQAPEQLTPTDIEFPVTEDPFPDQILHDTATSLTMMANSSDKPEKMTLPPIADVATSTASPSEVVARVFVAMHGAPEKITRADIDGLNRRVGREARSGGDSKLIGVLLFLIAEQSGVDPSVAAYATEKGAAFRVEEKAAMRAMAEHEIPIESLLTEIDREFATPHAVPNIGKIFDLITQAVRQGVRTKNKNFLDRLMSHPSAIVRFFVFKHLGTMEGFPLSSSWPQQQRLIVEHPLEPEIFDTIFTIRLLGLFVDPPWGILEALAILVLFANEAENSAVRQVAQEELRRLGLESLIEAE